MYHEKIECFWILRHFCGKKGGLLEQVWPFFVRISVLLLFKLTFWFQAPPGIKKNLQRTYDSWSPQFISRGNSSIRAQALFVLAWFHAIVQERRNYIPQVDSSFNIITPVTKQIHCGFTCLTFF